jgi:hypothetical protein
MTWPSAADIDSYLISQGITPTIGLALPPLTIINNTTGVSAAAPFMVLNSNTGNSFMSQGARAISGTCIITTFRSADTPTYRMLMANTVPFASILSFQFPAGVGSVAIPFTGMTGNAIVHATFNSTTNPLPYISSIVPATNQVTIYLSSPLASITTTRIVVLRVT